MNNMTNEQRLVWIADISDIDYVRVAVASSGRRAGHKITAPWPLTACPSFFRGAECPGMLHAADSTFRRRTVKA